jgi:4a-hydroxytetrahydrobiopterin dehydratase
MMAASRAILSATEIASRMAALPEWRIEDGKLRRQFRFADFPAAFAFMTRCAFVAERLDHHPEWFNVYNRVDVVLWTHDPGGITELDFALAAAMDDAV